MGCFKCIYHEQKGAWDHYCRKNAPTIKGEQAIWPKVNNQDWCGEFKKK